MDNTPQTPPKDLRKMADGPTLNIQDEENTNTNKKDAARTMDTPRLKKMVLLSLPRTHFKKPQGGESLSTTPNKTR